MKAVLIRWELVEQQRGALITLKLRHGNKWHRGENGNKEKTGTGGHLDKGGCRGEGKNVDGDPQCDMLVSFVLQLQCTTSTCAKWLLCIICCEQVEPGARTCAKLPPASPPAPLPPPAPASPPLPPPPCPPCPPCLALLDISIRHINY